MDKKTPQLTRRNFLQQSIGASFAYATSNVWQADVGSVEWLWSGALQPTSAQVNAKLLRNSRRVRLAISTRPDLKAARYSRMVAVDESVHRVAKLPIWGIRPNTTYFYGIEVDGQLDHKRGRLRTPALGAQSFAFAFGSCAHTGSTHQVFTTIRQQNPLFFMHMGDLHYFDIPTNERNKYRHGFNTVMASPTQANLYRNIPLAYMWDDHDYGPNDSDGRFIGRNAARLSYQENVPHYPLAAGFGDVPIYQAFTMGRIRFILTDTRSQRDSAAIAPNHPQKTMLGARQKAWLKRELVSARDRFPVTVWMCTSPWLADSPGSHLDNWNGFRAERRELANFIEKQSIKNLFYISGDAHQLAIDDGQNNQYADSRRPSFPLMIAAALDQRGSSFGGDNFYSEGQHPNGGQFGLMRFEDSGGKQVRVHWSGRNALNQQIVSLTKTVDSGRSAPTVSTAPIEPNGLSVDKREVRFVVGADSAETRTQSIQIHGDGIRWEATVLPSLPKWLWLSGTAGIAPSSLNLVAKPSQLPAGVHAVSLKITDSILKKSVWLTIKLILTKVNDTIQP